MKTKNAVRIISLCLAIVLASVGFLFMEIEENRRYELELKNNYSRNFDDFSAAVNNISLTLRKLKYATGTKQLITMAALLLSEAEISKSALSQMPQNNELTVLNRFFSQVGNYSMAISIGVSGNGEFPKNAEQNIALLADTAQKIADMTNNAAAKFNNSEYWAKEIEQKLNNTEALNLAVSLNEIEDSLADFPTLIYDGPYSDHILEKAPTLTENAEEITVEEALTVAADFCETEEKNLSFVSNSEGHIPSYIFGGEGLSVTVSRKGGYTVYMRKERETGKNILSTQQAREKGKRYLNRMGLSGFKETYYYLEEGMLLINYAYVDGETLCYTDLIKVGVAMDNGEILFYEAAGYISNHRERAFLTPAHSREEAAEKLNKSLRITGTRISLIPSAANEIRCYEFACTAPDGQEILVFINTQTLTEEDILILLKSDNGILVK